MNQILLSFVSTNGGLGTIANLEMHSIRKIGCLTGHDEYLESVLKTSLPDTGKCAGKLFGENAYYFNDRPVRPGQRSGFSSADSCTVGIRQYQCEIVLPAPREKDPLIPLTLNGWDQMYLKPPFRHRLSEMILSITLKRHLLMKTRFSR